mmetsp:Transcript_62319/g.129348  ORF Transcript_62319/g.129348 Transcript_62319/m.129348 type:complete len:217 (-) Transcript_62319:259-909(-)
MVHETPHKLVAVGSVLLREGKVCVPDKVLVIGWHNELPWKLPHQPEHHHISQHSSIQEFCVFIIVGQHLPQKGGLPACTLPDITGDRYFLGIRDESAAPTCLSPLDFALSLCFYQVYLLTGSLLKALFHGMPSATAAGRASIAERAHTRRRVRHAPESCLTVRGISKWVQLVQMPYPCNFNWWCCNPCLRVHCKKKLRQPSLVHLNSSVKRWAVRV